MQITGLTYSAQTVRQSAQIKTNPVQLNSNVVVTSTMDAEQSMEQKGVETLRIADTSPLNTSDYLSLRDKINPKKEGFLYENEQEGI